MFERYTSKLLLSPKTEIGGHIFDVYLSVSHQLSNQITEHPVQYGANLTDHVLNLPDFLTFQIGMSDCSQDIIPNDFSSPNPFNTYKKISFKGGKASIAINKAVIQAPFKELYTRYRMTGSPWASRSVNAFNKLKALKLKGERFDCVTRLGTYKDMVIQSIVATDDNTTAHGLLATVTCQQIFTGTVEKVTVQSTYQITKTTNSGLQNSRPVESVIHASGGLLNALTFGMAGG